MAATETPRAQQVALTKMAERMDDLEAEIADLRESFKRRIEHAQQPAQQPARANGKAKWLDSARYANACQGAGCNGRVQKGERCYYVPGTGVYHEACAPAGAKP